MDIFEGIKKYGPYHLASMAEVASPDRRDSEGAQFLTRVRNLAMREVERALEKRGDLAETLDAEADRIADQISDKAPNSERHWMWVEFVDLAVYREELDEPSEIVDQSLSGLAQVALIGVAYRLIQALMAELKEAAG